LVPPHILYCNGRIDYVKYSIGAAFFVVPTWIYIVQIDIWPMWERLIPKDRKNKMNTLSLEDDSPLTDLAPMRNRNKSFHSSISLFAFSSKSLILRFYAVYFWGEWSSTDGWLFLKIVASPSKRVRSSIVVSMASDLHPIVSYSKNVMNEILFFHVECVLDVLHPLFLRSIVIQNCFMSDFLSNLDIPSLVKLAIFVNKYERLSIKLSTNFNSDLFPNT